MRSLARKKPKKSYKAPVLRVYGDIQGLTATIGSSMGAADGGSGMGFNKTH